MAFIMRLLALFALLAAAAASTASSSSALERMEARMKAMEAELEKYRNMVASAGGERTAPEPEPTAMLEVDAEGRQGTQAPDSEDPTIQCQTICKFVR